MPKDVTRVEITEMVYKDPIEVIKQLTTHLDDVQFTKVIQTYVMENRKLNLSLEKEGSSFLKGKVVWLGNKKDDSEGTIFCIDTRSELKQISPTPENTSSIILDIKRETIKVNTESKSLCPVCGKNIEIFDETAGCPLCDSKAHKDHLIDWIRMKHSCPVCKKSLSISSTGSVMID